jgi:hypothetical protein
MYENNDSSHHEDEEERAFRDYAFESQWDDIQDADRVSLKMDNEGRWSMVLRIPKNKKPKMDDDGSFGFSI